jgi:site-specific DNA recombinase
MGQFSVQLNNLAAKTHRGLRGRVEEGKSGGGLCYGYRVVKKLDERGEAIRGGREIDEVQVGVVRRVFRDFAAGIGPRAIARTLNEEGITGPEGELWSDTTIRGHAKRGTGLINNELYIGRLVWNRQHYVKDPSTGRRVSRLNPASEWIVTEVPELRIVDDALWQAVKARQAEIAEKYVNVTEAVREHHANNRLNSVRRPRSLLSGLVYCGCCGGPYSLRGADRFVCSTHVGKGTCSNGRTILREELERRVLVGLRERLMAPEVAAEAMRTYAEETNRLNHERRSNRDTWKSELERTERELDKAIDAILAGTPPLRLKERMEVLEARRAELKALLEDAPEDVPDILPSAAPIYAKKIARLTEALHRPENQAEAAESIRTVIEKIVLRPGPSRGETDAQLYGELSKILNWIEYQDLGKVRKQLPGTAVPGVSESVVAGIGFEPMTFRL